MFGAATRRHHRPAAPANAALTKPADRLVHRERRHPGLGRRRRQRRHPLVQRRQPTRSGSRSTSAAPQTHLPGRANWEAAYATAFQIQVSGRRHHLDHHLLDHHRHRRHADAHRHRQRPLRAHVRHRPRHRLRLLALGVRGEHRTGSRTARPPVAAQPTDDPTSAPNVRIFDRRTPDADHPGVAERGLRGAEGHATSSARQRDALLFKPGTYNVYANIGFNTSIPGLGQNPDDVTINGAVTVDAFNASDAGNATQNFWRSRREPHDQPRRRRATAGRVPRPHRSAGCTSSAASTCSRGYGWSCGGYISDTRVDGSVESGVPAAVVHPATAPFGRLERLHWNMVFAGVERRTRRPTSPPTQRRTPHERRQHAGPRVT